MCLCVLSAGINQSVCAAEPLPTIEPFSGLGAFVNTHTLEETPKGGWWRTCAYEWVLNLYFRIAKIHLDAALDFLGLLYCYVNSKYFLFKKK